MGARWQPKADPAVQADRILDAAGRCIERRGVDAVTLGDVAEEAGCSRPTVYRYFADRDALRTAFVAREARRLGLQVATEVAHHHDPGDRLVAAVLASVAGVRDNPTLAAWFAPGGLGTTTALARASSAVAVLSASLVDPVPGDDHADGDGHRGDAARWLLRVILSLLSDPGADEDEERRLLERFVVPVLVGPHRGAPV